MLSEIIPRKCFKDYCSQKVQTESSKKIDEYSTRVKGRTNNKEVCPEKQKYILMIKKPSMCSTLLKYQIQKRITRH